MAKSINGLISAIEWRSGELALLDQRRLPHHIEWVTLKSVRAVAKAIRDMVVRGAPAIGITAAYGVVLAAQQRFEQSTSDWRLAIEADLEVLAASRPTAVNLFWAIERMRQKISTLEGEPAPLLLEEVLKEAKAIHAEDIAANQLMGRFGAEMIDEPCAVLTHCNAGALATGGYGTALGVIRSGFAAGRINHVYADETRPWLQGARLTAWEMVKEGIPVTLQVEGAAATLMQQQKIKWVIVGSDRIAANGDVANKIGTYSLAVLARHHGVKFMVVAPSSTIDMAIECGEQIPIEARPASEVLEIGGQPISPEGAGAWNPSFDVTPAALVDAIVTERGVVESPSLEKMMDLMR